MPFAKLKRILLDDDMDALCLLGGVMLLGWLWLAMRANSGNFMTEFASWHPIGGPVWWVITHLISACGLLSYSITTPPKNVSAIFGLWLIGFWGWQLIVRIDTAQTVGNVNNLMMILLGAMLFYRAGKRDKA